LQSLVGMQKDLNLDDAGRMGHAAAWSAPSTAPSTNSSVSTTQASARGPSRLICPRRNLPPMPPLRSPIWLRFCKRPQKHQTKELAPTHPTTQASARGLSRRQCPLINLRPRPTPPICNDQSPKSTTTLRRKLLLCLAFLGELGEKMSSPISLLH
jgi:hypothetical protein